MSASPPAPVSTGMAGLYRAFWRFAEGERPRIFVSSALLAGSQVVKLAIPWLAAQAINTIQLSGTASLQQTGGLILLILATALVAWSLHGPGRVIERSVGIRVRENLADGLYARVSDLPLAWHEAHHTGETQQRLDKASLALFNFAQSQFIYLQNFVNLAGPVVALLLLSTATGAAALAGYLAIGLIIVRFDRALLRLAERENRAHRRYSAALVDCLGNIATVVSLRLQGATRKLLRARLAETFAPFRRSLVLIEAKWCTVDMMSIGLAWGLVTLYAVLVQRDASPLMLGNVFMVYQYAQQAGGVIGSLATNYQNFARMQVDYGSAEPIWQAAERCPAPMTAPAHWRTLQVDGLQFCYGAAGEAGPSLDGASLTLRRGERVALVGPSGGGKTTLLRVMSGLYQAHSGCYSFDGMIHPGVRDLGGIATLVPQEAELFEGSVSDNITFGAEHAPARLAAAVRIAGLQQLIDALPQGPDTVLSERGLNLSGGQKQRIALARGILAASSSSLVLLDEPTSSLDALAEAQVFAELTQGFPDACIVASVHRLHLLARFDRVILMAGGRVLDSGSVGELLERQGLFRELWQRATHAHLHTEEELQAA